MGSSKLLSKLTKTIPNQLTLNPSIEVHTKFANGFVANFILGIEYLPLFKPHSLSMLLKIDHRLITAIDTIFKS